MGAAFCGAVCPAGPLFGWDRLACTGPVRPCLRRGRGVPGSAPTRLPCAPAGHRLASIAGRTVGCRAPPRSTGLAPAGPGGLNRRPGWGVAAPRLGVPVVARARSLTGLKRRPGWDWVVAGLRLHLPATTLRVTDGLNRRPGCCLPGSVSTVPAKDWPQTPARLSGSRFLRCVGGAGPRRGTSSQTARCGVSRFKTAVCAVCCGGTPTRPHPTVSYAANRRRAGWGRHR